MKSNKQNKQKWNKIIYHGELILFCSVNGNRRKIPAVFESFHRFQTRPIRLVKLARGWTATGTALVALHWLSDNVTQWLFEILQANQREIKWNHKNRNFHSLVQKKRCYCICFIRHIRCLIKQHCRRRPGSGQRHRCSPAPVVLPPQSYTLLATLSDWIVGFLVTCTKPVSWMKDCFYMQKLQPTQWEPVWLSPLVNSKGVCGQIRL